MSGGNNRIITAGSVNIQCQMQPGPNAYPAVLQLQHSGGVALQVFGGLSKLEYVAAIIEASIDDHEVAVDRAAALLAECVRRTETNKEVNDAD